MIMFSKIKSRFGGDLYKRIRTLSKYEREIMGGGIESVLERALLKDIKFLKTQFLFGSKLTLNFRNKASESLRSAINEVYTSSKNSKLLDFGGIIIPKPPVNNYTFENEFRHILLYYILEDKNLAEIIADEGPYESGSVQIESGDVVIDCGANLGIFSAIASHKCAEAVYAFEPNQEIIDKFLSITATNNPNIHICNYALSNKKEKLEFAFDHGHLSRGSLSFLNSGHKAKNAVTITVNSVTLDEFVLDKKLERVDFIKADIEGAERYMLMGARQVLKEFAPKLAICTYHLPDDPKVLREIILEANPNYVIVEGFRKMYAHIPKG